MLGINHLLMTATTPVGAADPYWSSTVLLLQNFGTAGTTSFVDLTGRHSPTTLSGSYAGTSYTAAASAGNPHFDSTSLLIGNTLFPQQNNDAGLDLGSSSDWSFGTGDFTIESFISIRGSNGSWQIYSSSQLQILFDGRTTGGSTTGLSFFVDGGQYQQYTNGFRAFGGTVSTDTWNHVAWSRTSGVTNFYLNGTFVSNLTDTINYSDGVLRIGVGWNRNNGFQGYMDMIRITKGVGRYTTNFTLPTVDYPTH